MTDENKLITDNRVASPVQNDQAKQHYIQRDDKLYLRVTLSFFMVGLATFALLYFVQPILPLLSDDFSVSPAQASLSLSLATGFMAVGLLITGPLSDVKM